VETKVLLVIKVQPELRDLLDQLEIKVLLVIKEPPEV
tara:strand:- start:693 stop:803 length:111 start_codon:yes stop_codon:yes gene_type:complete